MLVFLLLISSGPSHSIFVIVILKFWLLPTCTSLYLIKPKEKPNNILKTSTWYNDTCRGSGLKYLPALIQSNHCFKKNQHNSFSVFKK